MSDYALTAPKASTLYSKALSATLPTSAANRPTSPMLAMPSPPMSPYSRLASTTPSSPAPSVLDDLPGPVTAASTTRLSTPSFDHVHPLKRFAATAQPHYKLPTPAAAAPAPSQQQPPVTRAPLQQSHSSQPAPAAPYNSQTAKPLPSSEQVQRKLAEPARKDPAHAFGTYRLESFNPDAPLVSCCWTTLKRNPSAYLAREKAALANYKRHGPQSKVHVVTAHSSRRQAPAVQQPRMARVYKRSTAALYSSESESAMSTRSKKRPATATSALANELTSYAAVSRPLTPASSRPSTPKPRATPSSAPSTPKPQRATTTTNNKVHDLNPSLLVDYSPPVSSLPVGKSLRAEWKGAPMDLSTDPNLHLLHSAEVHLAAVLRLPADVYIDSKKRLFAEKVHRLRQGLPFRRTDSQKACRIDVNKASRLFSAFEKVGWLEDELFTKYL